MPATPTTRGKRVNPRTPPPPPDAKTTITTDREGRTVLTTVISETVRAITPAELHRITAASAKGAAIVNRVTAALREVVASAEAMKDGGHDRGCRCRLCVCGEGLAADVDLAGRTAALLLMTIEGH